ncbi:unnamed protein product [Toxocara canis]|uniref:Secreted protein n=1 Tax=Toxocara canis TaxID=6265 RepID=A0A183U2D3_TOXCA|nr:unnamed protein product [Toxocara canis]
MMCTGRGNHAKCGTRKSGSPKRLAHMSAGICHYLPLPMITMLLALLNILFTKVESTPSVMQCPININLIGAGQGFPFGGALTPGGE